MYDHSGGIWREKNVPGAGALSVGAWARVPDALVRHDGWLSTESVVLEVTVRGSLGSSRGDRLSLARSVGSSSSNSKASSHSTCDL